MGCTGERTYEEAVKLEIRRYLNTFFIPSTTKRQIEDYIYQDLKKRAMALQNYQYIYREEDVKQTVDDYKVLIWEEFKVGNKPYGEDIEQENKDNKDNKEKDNKDKTNENNNNVNNDINNNKNDDIKDNDKKENNIINNNN
mgnify:CR=1 FL=1